MSSSLSTSTIFGVSFLATLFAILCAGLLVYTYTALWFIPKLRRGLPAVVEAMAQGARTGEEWVASMLASQKTPTSPAMRIIFTCEDHGRCDGCPRVLAQFEAIIRHQGEASFDEVERRCYGRLKARLRPCSNEEAEVTWGSRKQDEEDAP